MTTRAITLRAMVFRLPLRRSRLLVCALFCALTAAVSATGPAAAQSARSERSRSELEQIERRLEARRKEEARLKDEAKAREREIASLRRSMIETAEALQDAERRIETINREMARLEGEEATVKASLDRQRTHLAEILAALQSLERARPPALLVSPDDSTAAARAAMLLSDAAPELQQKAAALRADLDRLLAVQARLETERAAFRRVNADVSDRRALLAELLLKKQAERDVAQRLAAAAQSETAALAARATTLRGVLSRLERLARYIVPRPKPDRFAAPRAPSRARIRPRRRAYSPKTAFSSARGAMASPVVGDIVGQFGDRRPTGGRFEGVRFAPAPNAIVTAPHEAKVVFARFYEPTGNLIVLDVGASYHILLMGVDSFLVDEGQTVQAGEPLAVMSDRRGPNEAGGGLRLDLEIRRAQEPVNPALWLKRQIEG